MSDKEADALKFFVGCCRPFSSWWNNDLLGNYSCLSTVYPSTRMCQHGSQDFVCFLLHPFTHLLFSSPPPASARLGDVQATLKEQHGRVEDTEDYIKSHLHKARLAEWFRNRRIEYWATRSSVRSLTSLTPSIVGKSYFV